MKPAAIILGAGRSKRFGDGNKLLALLDGKALIRHVVDTARQAGLANLVIVTGHMSDEVGAAVAGAGACIVHNPDFANGMASSIRVGIAALANGEDAAFLMLGDMPLVRTNTLERLTEAAQQNPDKWALIPIENHRRGNPVLFRAAMFPALCALGGDAGARRVLETMPDQVLEISCDDPGIHVDFDTRHALEGLLKSTQLQ